jgi:elongation factor G
MVLIVKLDRENADFAQALAAVQARFGKASVPIQVPIGAFKSFKGVVDLLSRRAYTADGAGGDPPAELAAEIEQRRERLVEAICETDDDLAT